VDVNINFFSPHGKTASLKETVNEIVSFISKDPKGKYKIIVGSDSSVFGLEPFSSSIITVIIAWRIGKGATYFWTRSKKQMFYSLHDRIICEAMESITLAQEVRSHLVALLGHDFLWDGSEIHVDVGTEGESRVFIREVTGLIRGFDFVPVIKPEAWCASTVADRHT